MLYRKGKSIGHLFQGGDKVKANLKSTAAELNMVVLPIRQMHKKVQKIPLFPFMKIVVFSALSLLLFSNKLVHG